MYARTIRASIVPGKVDEAIATYRDSILPVVRSQPGYVSTTVMANREKLEAFVVTLWETKEAAEATGEGTDYLNRMLGHMRFVLVSRHIQHWETPIADHV